MKKKMNRYLLAAFIMSFAIYMLFGKISQLLPMGSQAVLMPLVTFVFMIILGIGISRYANEHVLRPMSRLADQLSRFADGEKDVFFDVGKTDFDELQQICSCMGRIQTAQNSLQNRWEKNEELGRLETERSKM